MNKVTNRPSNAVCVHSYLEKLGAQTFWIPDGTAPVTTNPIREPIQNPDSCPTFVHVVCCCYMVPHIFIWNACCSDAIDPSHFVAARSPLWSSIKFFWSTSTLHFYPYDFEYYMLRLVCWSYLTKKRACFASTLLCNSKFDFLKHRTSRLVAQWSTRHSYKMLIYEGQYELLRVAIVGMKNINQITYSIKIYHKH